MAGRHVSKDPATKPQPVRLFGAVVSGLTFMFSGLTLVAGFGDNPTIATVSGFGLLVLGGLNIMKDEYVKGQVVPLPDVGSYLNVDREVVPGPAAAEVESKSNGEGA